AWRSRHDGAGGRNLDRVRPDGGAGFEEGRALLVAKGSRIATRPGANEAITRPRCRDVEQPSLFVDGGVALRRRLRHEVVGKLEVEGKRRTPSPSVRGAPRDEHHRPLQALCAM